MQSGGGGVLSMTKGTALFDAVAISGTAAAVRAGQCGDAQLGRVSADGVRGPIAMGVAAMACAQRSGGVVSMFDGAVTFKGGSISNSTSVRACAERESRVRAPWYGMLRGAARPMDGAHGAAHACCGEWCTVYGALSRSGACEYAFRIERPGCCGGRAAARCARAQIAGGVLSMTKGTALFDAVAISGTEAGVRAGLVR